MATTTHNNDEIYNADDKNIAGKVSSSGGSSDHDVQYGSTTLTNINGDFVDRTISVRDWGSRTFDDIPGQLKHYVVSLFPIATWIYRYNFTWFIGDVSCQRSVTSSSSSSPMAYFDDVTTTTTVVDVVMQKKFLSCGYTTEHRAKLARCNWPCNSAASSPPRSVALKFNHFSGIIALTSHQVIAGLTVGGKHCTC